MSEQISKIILSGSPAEIGFTHGELLKDQVQGNIEFYKALFLKNFGTENRILKTAHSFREQINLYNPEYAVEIEHIALGAGVSEPLWIYALNARIEIALARPINECTAVVFPSNNLLGQTWDWAQSLLDNFVIMQIDLPSGMQILQLTEAGIIGKIGFNNCSLGVTLNILWIPGDRPAGVPVHILLRAILESKTLEEAREAVSRSGGGKASNLIVCQNGSAIDFEFYGEGAAFQEIKKPAYVHTNHIIHSGSNFQVEGTDLAGSLARYAAVEKNFQNARDFSQDEMVSILSECPGGEGLVLAPYKPDAQSGLDYIGTLATVVMDLVGGMMFVRKGNPSLPSFSNGDFVQHSI
jgi:isopenicillin-N N-acyltransferase-like protein